MVSNSPRWVLALGALCGFVMALDSMVVTTALAAIREDLHTSIATLQWTTNAYNLCFALLLLAGAALGDRFGRRRMLLAGLGVFLAASAMCALSTDVAWLIAGRALQGVGAAFVMPLAMALVSAAFPREQRARALGTYGAVVGVALIVGPALGGAVAQGLAWPWIFWVNLPIGLVLMALIRRHVAESRVEPAVLDAAALLPLRLFRSNAFSGGIACSVLLYAPMYGVLFMLPQFLQAQGLDVLGVGLRLIPWTATLFVVAPLAGRAAGRFGERTLVGTGLVLQAAGLAWLATAAAAGAGYASLVPMLLMSGAGVSMAMPALQSAVMGAVAPVDIGKASGVFNMARFLGGAGGVALLVAVFERSGAVHSAASFSAGFRPAMATAALLSLLGGALAWRLPARERPATAGTPQEMTNERSSA